MHYSKKYYGQNEKIIDDITGEISKCYLTENKQVNFTYKLVIYFLLQNMYRDSKNKIMQGLEK